MQRRMNATDKRCNEDGGSMDLQEHHDLEEDMLAGGVHCARRPDVFTPENSTKKEHGVRRETVNGTGRRVGTTLGVD